MGGGGIALVGGDDSTIDRFLVGVGSMVTPYRQDGSGGGLRTSSAPAANIAFVIGYTFRY